MILHLRYVGTQLQMLIKGKMLKLTPTNHSVKICVENAF